MTTTRNTLAFIAALCCASKVQAQLNENFDGYANQTAFSTAWKPVAGQGLTLTTTNSASGQNSVMNWQTTAVGAANYHGFMDPLKGETIDFLFKFYDNGNGNARDYGTMVSKAGTTWAGANQQLLSIGKYNNTTTTKYFGRIGVGSFTLLDGATASIGGGGWFTLDAAPVVSKGWHSAEIKGMVDPVNAGKFAYSFYIDGVLGGTAGNITAQNYNWAMVGSGLGSTGGYLTFDDVKVGGVFIPEPSSATLAIVGGLLLAVRVIYRRRK